MEALSKILLVFPTSRAIRQYINEQGSSNILLPKIITIGDLFSILVLNKDKIVINNDLRILYLQDAISTIDIKKLGLSNSFSKFYNQSEYIFKFFTELNTEFKNIEDLNNFDTYEFYLEHLYILNKIYKQYCFILDKNNKIDLSILPRDYIINKEYITQFDKIIINYEGYFSSYEFNIIKEISNYVDVHINMYTNKFNTKNIKMFKNINIDLCIDNKYTLDITNKSIISKQEYKNDLINHEIYPVKQRIVQIAFIKYAITQLIKDGISDKNIAVILPDETFSSYLKIFDDENYFNFAMGNDIKLSSTYIKANAIFDFLNKNEPKDEDRLSYFDIDTNFIENIIKVSWNEKINKDNFFSIIDFLCKNENNEDIIEHIMQIKLSLDVLFFSNYLNEKQQYDIKLKDGYKILLNKINKITLDDTKSGKITVIGILETRDVSYDGVIVVDFNDDKIPKKSIKDKFISTKVKENVGLPTIKDREDLQKYYYKRLFDKSKKIYISYVDDDSNTISRFSEQLFKKQNIKNADFIKILNTKNDINLYDKDISMNIDLSLIQWSASSLKTYLDCKRKYYFSNILKIKEHSINLKPKAYELGQIIHKVLENIYKDKVVTYDNLSKQIANYQNKNPYLTLELEVWKKKLRVFINNEEVRLKDDIDSYSLEKSFKINYNGITIKGVIDRIDKLKDNSYIILDYKTSSNLKIDTLKTYEKSNDFQLEFYYLGLNNLNINSVGYYDLNDGSIKYEIVLEQKIQRLDNIFKSLKTQKVNFTKCEDTKICTYCTYKTICGRD